MDRRAVRTLGPYLAVKLILPGLRSRQLTLALNLTRALGGGFDEAALLVAAAH